MKEKSRILIPMLWGATAFAGAANVLRLFQNARINGGWYGPNLCLISALWK